MSEFPTAEEVLAIASQPDAVVRNLWITWSYYRLNRAMAAMIGERDLSWCGFATWASKTAGTFIRQEELGPFIEKWLDGSLLRAGFVARTVTRLLGLHHPTPTATEAAAVTSPRPLAALLAHFSLRAFARMAIGQVGDAIGAGNQDVFRHIAAPFARALALWTQHDGKIPEADQAAFLASLHELGDADQGQYLARAFEATFAAAAATDPRARAQLMLQANALIGCAEQTRVQPFIETSMNAPIEDLFHQHLLAHLKGRFFEWLVPPLQALLRPLGKALEDEFRDLSTELIMTLKLPGESLRLGRDVPRLPDGRMYPLVLETLEAPSPLQLFEELKAVDDMGSAARDWARYTDRMRYIGVLFRSRQQVRDLWGAPFTETQVTELQSGKLPSGPL